MHRYYDIAVIGGGPAGMLAAGTAAGRSNLKVLLIEKNKSLGKKLLLTGKGRCNITNKCTKNEFINNVVHNKKFLYSAINKFSSEDTINFFQNLGLRTKVERGNRVFPCTDSSKDVLEALRRFLKNSRCNLLQADVKDIIIKNNVKKLIFTNKDVIYCKKLILACGGKSYPSTGSDGSGFILAKKLGHSIITPRPSLVGLVSSDNFCKALQGLTLKNIQLKLIDVNQNKVLFQGFGEMLFTHFGLSGPLILSASAHIESFIHKKQYKILIDLKPALSFEQLDQRLLNDFNQNSNKNFSNSLNRLLPAKLIPIIITLSNINPEQKCNNITRPDRLNLVRLLKSFEVNIMDFRPIQEAIATAGGVNVKEINPRTMESKLIKGLFFAGEMIDVDAYTGGFNLQIAFSTGYLAAEGATT